MMTKAKEKMEKTTMTITIIFDEVIVSEKEGVCVGST